VSSSAEGEINHWPGFVDALTTIIMVVTFLLIILGVAVFVMSKKIVEQVHQTEMRPVPDAKGLPQDIGELQRQLASAQQEIMALKRSNSDLKSPEDAEDGTSIAAQDDLLRQDEKVQGDTRLSIRTRKTDETLKLRVAAEEKPETQTGSDVRVAELLLDIDFEPEAVEFSEPSKLAIKEFLTTRAKEVGTGQIEIWSFAPSTTSVSETQRVAYYRALLMRNLLIERGIPATRIKAQVRVDDQTNRGHTIKVVLKP
jgi:hypothetical protein